MVCREPTDRCFGITTNVTPRMVSVEAIPPATYRGRGHSALRHRDNAGNADKSGVRDNQIVRKRLTNMKI